MSVHNVVGALVRPNGMTRNPYDPQCTCCLWLISLGYADLIIATPQIELAKVSCIAKLIEQVINVRDEILVFYSNLVECSIVDA